MYIRIYIERHMFIFTSKWPPTNHNNIVARVLWPPPASRTSFEPPKIIYQCRNNYTRCGYSTLALHALNYVKQPKNIKLHFRMSHLFQKSVFYSHFYCTSCGPHSLTSWWINNCKWLCWYHWVIWTWAHRWRHWSMRSPVCSPMPSTTSRWCFFLPWSWSLGMAPPPCGHGPQPK